MHKTIALFALLTFSVSAVELTPETWDDAVTGKAVFIKFFAPWCGHCKKMKPAWDELMEEYKDSSTYLVADVDCTAAGKPLCDKNGVRGFPSLMYGDASDLTKYTGGRDLGALKAHVLSMEPMCSPFNVDACSDDQKAIMKTYQEMDAAALASELSTTEKELKVAEVAHKKEIAEKEAAFAALKAEKSSSISMMKSVTAFASKGEAKDEL